MAIKEFMIFSYPNNKFFKFYENLTKIDLNQIDDDINEIACWHGKNITEISDDFSRFKSLKILSFDYFIGEKFPALPKSLEELTISSDKIIYLPELPSQLKEIEIRCPSLKTLPENILNLDHLTELELEHCKSLVPETAELLRKLEEKHAGASNTRFSISWPTNLSEDQSVDPKKSINIAYKQYYQTHETLAKKEPKIEDELNYPTLKLFHRFLSENLVQRRQKTVIFSEGREVAKIIEKQPNLLEIFDPISIDYLKKINDRNACINQPVMGFSEIAVLAEMANKADPKEKLAVAKRMAVIEAIKAEVLQLKNESGLNVGSGVQVELGNAMLKAIYNKDRTYLEKQTGGKLLGIASEIAYEDTIQSFLTQENIDSVSQTVNQLLKKLEKPQAAINHLLSDGFPHAQNFAKILLADHKEHGFAVRKQKIKQLKDEHSEITDISSDEAQKKWQEIQKLEKGDDLLKIAKDFLTEILTEKGVEPENDSPAAGGVLRYLFPTQPQTQMQLTTRQQARQGEDSNSTGSNHPRPSCFAPVVKFFKSSSKTSTDQSQEH